MTALRLAILLLPLCWGCRRVPESVLLQIDGIASPAASLRLSVFDGTGAVVRDRLLGAAGSPLALPASAVLYPPAGSGPIRIDVRAILGTSIQAEGAATATPQPDRQLEVKVVLQPGALPDLDGDGVPDAIDTCRAIPNPDQRPGSCPAADAAIDQTRVRDVLPERGRDAVPDVPADARSDRPSDQRPPDQKKPDQKKPDQAKPDQQMPDLKPPDLKPSPDLPVYKPVTASALSAAFIVAKVPCINAQGAIAGSPIAIVDTAAVSFVAPLLASAPATTLTWLGGKPAVMVLWDPNACDLVELPSGGPDWVTAGLLIRGASIDGQNRLHLQTGVTLDDINLVDTDATGVISEENFLPDDSTLASFPQLVQTVVKAKQLVLQTAAP